MSSANGPAGGLDVVTGEWRGDLQDHPLIRYPRTHDNLLILPHLGGCTYESQAYTLEHTCKELARWLRDHPFR